MTLVVHYLNDSRAHRVLWLLEELKVPYEVKMYWRNKKTHLAPPELKEVHPSGKSPVIVDDGLVVAESGLICEYVVNKYGKGSEMAPRGAQDELDIKYGLHSAEANLATAAMQLYIFRIGQKRLPFGLSHAVGLVTGQISAAWAGPELELNLDILNSFAKKNGGYMVGGRLTGADIMYETWVTLLKREGLIPQLETKYPELNAWHQRLQERPAYVRAQAAAAKL